MQRLIVKASFLCFVITGYCGHPLAAQQLEAVAAAVGGTPSGPGIPGVCSTYGSPLPIGLFFGSVLAPSVPQGGIAFCGYSGDVNDQTTTAGPVSATQSVGPVLLGNPGFAGEYTGSASATADYWQLGASSHGEVTAPAGNPLALAASSGAAFFQDTFTVTTLPPFITIPSNGFVRYTFDVHGSLTARTAQIPFDPSDTGANLSFEHDPGTGSLGVFPVVRFQAGAGAPGFIISLDGNTAGFTPGPSSISGAGTFTSAVPLGFGGVADFPIKFGTPFSMKAGLLASVGGDGDASFIGTATLTRIDLFDANHNPLTNYVVTGASGKSFSTLSDVTPPTTIAVPSPGPNGNGWNNSNVTVTLTATDNAGGSGVKQIQYSLSGAQTGGNTVSGNSAAFGISAEGVTIVSYSARDNAGNSEAPKTLIVQIEKTPPTVTATATPAPNANGWNNTNVTASVTGTDPLSGIAFCTAPTTFTSEGAGQSFSGSCTDRAGNDSNAPTVTVNIDKTPPAISDFRVRFGSQSYSLIGSPRSRLPWQVSGIQVVFTEPIMAGSVASLGGISATGFSGLGTKTLTWTFNPIALADVVVALAGTGPNALTDIAGNAVGGGSGFSQRLRVLLGDANDDGVVNASDLVVVNSATAKPYNISDDINGDGLITLTDVNLARTRIGTSLP